MRQVRCEPGGGGGYSHTLPIRVCATQRGRDLVYGPKMAYKTTNVRYFDEAYQDSTLWEKYQPYHMSLSVGAKRAILGKY